MADDGLPPEILAEILSRLPVESLLRFRSTSKSLKSLIDSHNFINLHLKNPLNQSVIIRNNSDIYQLQIDDNDFSNRINSIIPLNHPFKGNSPNIDPYTRRDSTMALIGSCNGLLAISNGQIAFTHPNAANEITIWNPNTRKHLIIPFLPMPVPYIMESNNPNRGCLCVHGFGFDSLTGDYKLLRISWLLDLQNPFYDPHVRLFSSKTNSWKIVPSFPYSLEYCQTMGVFIDNSNSIHWVANNELFEPRLIFAFNLTFEIFNEVPLPVEISQIKSNKSFGLDVAVLGGCLCMTVNYKKTTKFDVWVMKEYGSRDSWCKLCTVDKSCFTSPLKSLRPLCYSSDGSKVLLEGIQVLLKVDHRKLFWYDWKSEQVSYIEGVPNLNGAAMICVESLVSPPFPVDNCRKKEDRTSKSKRRYFF
ncbi:F-box protein interaction domain protein [Medicago truncatula]|uniref:F-box protein interaction domain protein n=1 Tax=Medicago truncatula TaxID=3880 RepID=G7J9H0_MEDTR|nr:F-box protein interaction domain protein [Medicago truncatula]